MLHVISSSPFVQTTLQSCLEFMRPDDQLILIQDAVIASTVDKWGLMFRDRNIYVLHEDLLARGLTAKAGKIISMDEYVDLVVIHGSPLCW